MVARVNSCSSTVAEPGAHRCDVPASGWGRVFANRIFAVHLGGWAMNGDLLRRDGARPQASLPVRLGLLVAGTTLPLIIFAAGIVLHSYIQDRAEATQRVLETVRSL